MEKIDNFVPTNIISTFRLPRFSEIPDVGLYLEQTTKYINNLISPIGFGITGSMIRNYVKMGLVCNPVHKLYDRDRIAHIISIAILKNVLSLENIAKLFARQKKVYSDEVAYDYFCKKLESMIFYQFGIVDTIDKIGSTDSVEKKMLRSAIVAVSHITYLNACFAKLSEDYENE